LQDSQKIPWKRIAAEGAAVVVSILIAFWIDAWWQERSERVALVEYLVQFENEVIANDELIDAHLSEISGDLVALHRVFLVLSNSDQQALPESFGTDLGRALYFGSPAVRMNAYDDLANSGNFRFVRNAEFKRVINEYKNSVDVLDIHSAFLTSVYLDHVVPAIGPYIALSNLGWEMYENNLAPDGVNTGVTPAAPFSTNVGGLKSQAVWNALFSWKSGKIDKIRRLNQMKEFGLELRDLLRAEIEYQNQ
jgi:hypothetical protein